MNSQYLPLEELIHLRRQLHKHPEIAGKEKNTSKRIKDFINNYKPDDIIENIGGYGLAFIFNGKAKGPAVLIRSELDALPIDEINDFAYKSDFKNVAHKCGHDGHMTIVAGIASLISNNKPNKGKIILLYQPSEETGEGAERILNDKKFKTLKPDYVFALHNIPGYEQNEILVKNGIFASASKGLIIRLRGKESHASAPESGNNPSNAVADIIKMLNNLVSELNDLKNFSLITIIHVNIGEEAFGTSPGNATIMATLRSYENEDLDLISNSASEKVKSIAENYNLEFNISWTEEFPATINDAYSADIIRESAIQNNLYLKEIDKPFRWSEDFGHFTSNFKGAMLGLGSGKNHPDLHNPDYDFPEEIIPTGVKMFYTIINKILT